MSDGFIFPLLFNNIECFSNLYIYKIYRYICDNRVLIYRLIMQIVISLLENAFSHLDSKLIFKILEKDISKYKNRKKWNELLLFTGIRV